MKSDAIRRFNFGTVPTKMLSTFSFLLVVVAVDVVISLFGEKKQRLKRCACLDRQSSTICSLGGHRKERSMTNCYNCIT